MYTTSFVEVPLVELLERVQTLKHEGNRFVQMCAETTERGIDLLYTFYDETRDHALNLCVYDIDASSRVPSIQGLYFAAFSYENEAHDLYGVNFANMKLDFGGHFFNLAANEPMTVISPEMQAERAKLAKVKAAKAAKEAAAAKKAREAAEAASAARAVGTSAAEADAAAVAAVDAVKPGAVGAADGKMPAAAGGADAAQGAATGADGHQGSARTEGADASTEGTASSPAAADAPAEDAGATAEGAASSPAAAAASSSAATPAIDTSGMDERTAKMVAKLATMPPEKAAKLRANLAAKGIEVPEIPASAPAKEA